MMVRTRIRRTLVAGLPVKNTSEVTWFSKSFRNGCLETHLRSVSRATPSLLFSHFPPSHHLAYMFEIELAWD